MSAEARASAVTALARQNPADIFRGMEEDRKVGEIDSFLIGVEALSRTEAIEIPSVRDHLRILGDQEGIWQGAYHRLKSAEERGNQQEVQGALRTAELLGLGELPEVADRMSNLRQRFTPAPAAVDQEAEELDRLRAEAERKLVEEADYLGTDDPMVVFNLWQSESRPPPRRVSPESRRGDQEWWQMTQAEFLEKYPDPNTSPTQRAAFALLHRMMLENELLTYRESGSWNVIPEEVIAEYPDLKEQYEQAKTQVFEQPYEPVPQLSEEAKTKLEDIFKQLNKATDEDSDYAKRQKLSEDAEDQITAILNRQNVRVPVSGLRRRVYDLPFSLEDHFYRKNLKLAQKIFDQATPELRQVFAIGQEAVRIYDDRLPGYYAKTSLSALITRASGVRWSKAKEAVDRNRLRYSLRDNFYHGLTGRSYDEYLLDGPEAGRMIPELEVLVQNFQGMNSAEVTYFQPANMIAQARETYIADLADRAGLKFIPVDGHNRWSLVQKIEHREISPLIQKKRGDLTKIFTKLEAAEKQANDAEDLKLQLAKTLELSGDENPVTEKTRQEMRISTFTSWENLEWFMQPGQTDYSTRLFAEASPQIRGAFERARNAYSVDAEEQGYYAAQYELINLIGKEAGLEGAREELQEKERQQTAYEGYFNKVLLPRFSTAPVNDLAEAFIDANILENSCLRLRQDIDQRENNYFRDLIRKAGLPSPYAKPKRKSFLGGFLVRRL